MDITPEQLRFLREQRKLSRDELAKDLDCSASAIVHWESGNRSIPPWVADKMFAKLPITFTLQDLAEMFDLCREKQKTMSELIQESVRLLLQQHRTAQAHTLPKVRDVQYTPAIERFGSSLHGLNEAPPSPPTQEEMNASIASAKAVLAETERQQKARSSGKT